VAGTAGRIGKKREQGGPNGRQLALARLIRFYHLDPTRSYPPIWLDVLHQCIPLLRAEEAREQALPARVAGADGLVWSRIMKEWEVAARPADFEKRTAVPVVTTEQAREWCIANNIAHVYDPSPIH
jgi:hypothetical protein